jgi:hypothetical protein
MVMRMLFILLCLPALSTAQPTDTELSSYERSAMSYELSAARAQSAAAEPGLRALLDRQTAQVGDRVVLSLRYVLPEGAGLTEPPEIKGVEDLTLVDVQKEEGALRLLFIVDRLKDWETKQISLFYHEKDGTRRELTAGPVSLTVASNLGEKPAGAALRPIYEIIPVRSWWQVHFAWIAGGFAMLLLGAGLLWWIKRRITVRGVTATVAFPHIRARIAIEDLERLGLFEKGYVKAFYFRISEILRQYMEALRGFPAPELTTEEIAVRVTTEEDRRALALLRQADLAKFADTVPTLARKEEEMREMLAYVDETGTVFEPRRTEGKERGARS